MKKMTKKESAKRTERAFIAAAFAAVTYIIVSFFTDNDLIITALAVLVGPYAGFAGAEYLQKRRSKK